MGTRQSVNFDQLSGLSEGISSRGGKIRSLAEALIEKCVLI